MQPTYGRKQKKIEYFQISENLEKIDDKSQRILTFPISPNIKKQFSEIFDKIDDKSRQIGTFQNTAGATYAKKKLNIQMLSLFASNSNAPSLI